MKEKVTFKYKNGFIRVEFKNVSDKHLELLKSEICKEQLKRKEAQQFGKVERFSFKKEAQTLHPQAQRRDHIPRRNNGG